MTSGWCRRTAADAKGAESIYFTVPGGSGSQPILQAIFEPDYRPSAMEFKLLKAAASLAAAVLEFAPDDQRNTRPMPM